MIFMTKKEYFASPMCSQKARSLITAGWIVFGVCTGISVLLTLIGLVGVLLLFSGMDFSKGLDFVLEELKRQDLDDYSEFIEDLDIFESVVGMPVNEFLDIIIVIAIVTTIVALVATALLNLFAILKKNLAVAIIALVFSVITANTLAVITAITLLVIVCILNSEYNKYSSKFVNSTADFSGESIE